MNFSITKAIPLVAGSITILNFLFSIIPVISSPPRWFVFLSGAMKPEFKFIIFFIITMISSLGTVKFLIHVDKTNASPSTKLSLVSILTAIFAWIVVFNIKIIVLKNSLEGANQYAFPLSCFIFSFFSAIKLRLDFKELGHEIYEKESESQGCEFWPFGNHYTPIYLRMTRFFTFWFVIILGGYFYDLTLN